MSTEVRMTNPPIIYPESDGKPMADNTLQFRWIVTLEGNLEAMYQDDPNVFVAGDLFWYPIEGDNKTRVAPDTMVVFGRPKGERRSYLQWRENNIPPQVVFEVLSPGNRPGEMIRKFRFYERFGVEEYFIYDPDNNELTGWIRDGSILQEIPDMSDWVSPRLGIRFEMAEDQLRLHMPDGRPFLTYLELFQQSQSERQRAETERQRAERLAEQLRALGVQPVE